VVVVLLHMVGILDSCLAIEVDLLLLLGFTSGIGRASSSAQIVLVSLRLIFQAVSNFGFFLELVFRVRPLAEEVVPLRRRSVALAGATSKGTPSS